MTPHGAKGRNSRDIAHVLRHGGGTRTASDTALAVGEISTTRFEPAYIRGLLDQATPAERDQLHDAVLSGLASQLALAALGSETDRKRVERTVRAAVAEVLR